MTLLISGAVLGAIAGFLQQIYTVATESTKKATTSSTAAMMKKNRVDTVAANRKFVISLQLSIVYLKKNSYYVDLMQLLQ